MRLVLSRKGFDSASGGCPSPIFPDGSMLALPIPDRTSAVWYEDLVWRGRNLGEVVETLTGGKKRRVFGAHLDPDLRASLRPRPPGWRPALGQLGAAQGHLRNHGVGSGDLFVLWGLFRRVDARLRWEGPAMHVIWGWLQVATVAPVDATIRPALGGTWRWAEAHPHLAFPPDPANTLYVAADRLDLPGLRAGASGAGVFDLYDDARRLTAPGAKGPGTWKLPLGFLPGGRAPLSYHSSAGRWTPGGDHVLLEVATRGQEFVLDGDEYPEVLCWIARLLAAEGGSLSSP